MSCSQDSQYCSEDAWCRHQDHRKRNHARFRPPPAESTPVLDQQAVEEPDISAVHPTFSLGCPSTSTSNVTTPAFYYFPIPPNAPTPAHILYFQALAHLQLQLQFPHTQCTSRRISKIRIHLPSPPRVFYTINQIVV